MTFLQAVNFDKRVLTNVKSGSWISAKQLCSGIVQTLGGDTERGNECDSWHLRDSANSAAASVSQDILHSCLTRNRGLVVLEPFFFDIHMGTLGLFLLLAMQLGRWKETAQATRFLASQLRNFVWRANSKTQFLSRFIHHHLMHCNNLHQNYGLNFCCRWVVVQS